MLNLKNFKLKTSPSDLENEIARLFAELSKIDDITDPKYDLVSDQLKKLYALKEIDSKSRMSLDALLGAATNLAGILIIVNHEYMGAITSKALGMVGKKIVS